MTSIWEMSGADLSRAMNEPAPITVLRGGHAPSNLAGVLAQIAALPAKEQAELVKAFAAALKPEPKQIGGNTFRNAEQFYPAFNAAREAARAECGPRWHLDPNASLMARVPAAWLAIKGEMAVYRSPRDVNFPAARFWPGGVLPNGPDYAPHGPVAKSDPIPETTDRNGRRLLGVNRAGQPVFALEPTPENIDMAEAA